MNRELMVNNIKELCKNRNMTVTGLEDTLGFSQGLIGRWKDKSPTLDRVIDIADYFSVSIDDMVGRTIPTNDAFLEVVYNMTNNGTFQWDKVSLTQSYIVAPKMTELYNEDEFSEVYYYTSLDEGYITMRCFSQHNKTLHPEKLDLFIQPSIGSDRVYQNYSVEQLLPLWVLVLSKTEDVPIDVKAENMKQKLIKPHLFTNRIFAYADKFNSQVDAANNNKEE